MDNGFFLIKLQDEEEVERALTEGPWTILGHYLTVNRWSPSFKATNSTITTVSAWIRFPNLPIQYYREPVLRKIATAVGKPLKVDLNTQLATRGKFARVAVEIDLTKPLLSQFTLDEENQKIEYEGLPQVCFHCGRVGHNMLFCP